MHDTHTLRNAWQTAKCWPRALMTAGHRPGSLLRRLRSDFADCDFRSVAADEAAVVTKDGTLEVRVRETIDARFLMHVAGAEFILDVPASHPHPGVGAPALVNARHSGAIRRTGVQYVPAGGSDAAAELQSRLADCAALSSALLPLDFTRCRFEVSAAGASMRVRHFGACELVGHLPKYRRYVRLEAAQSAALLAAFQAFRAIMRG